MRNNNPQNLWNLVAPSFAKYAKKSAWICREKKGHRVVSYQQLHNAALVLANKLRDAGVSTGDTIAIAAPNGPEWTVAALATWRLSAIVAPIHVTNSEHEITQQIKAIAPKLTLAHQSPIEFDNAMQIEFDEDDGAIAREQAESINDDPHLTAIRIYTSGSTGTPKVVRLTHDNIISNIRGAELLEDFNENDRYLVLLPFSHAMGITGNFVLPIYSGATLVAPKVLAAAEILQAMEQEKISVIIAVPRLFRNIMLGLEKKFSEGGKALQLFRRFLEILPISLRTKLNSPIRKRFGGNIKIWVSGGSHLDGNITSYYHKLGLPLRQGYGLTETAPLTSVQARFDTAPNSVGKPMLGVQVKLHNPNENGIGELWIKGPNVMTGYDDEQQSAEALEDGWFKSGDLAKIDEQGRITLTGRSKRLIVTEAGKNVYPEELETLLERNPNIKEAAVLEMVMKPVCILAMEGDDPQVSAKAAVSEFNQLVSAHNKINRIAVVEELPRTPLGKIALAELPAVFAANEMS